MQISDLIKTLSEIQKVQGDLLILDSELFNIKVRVMSANHWPLLKEECSLPEIFCQINKD